MKTIGLFTAITISLAGAAGCGGGSGGSVALTDLPSQYASAYCMKAVSCCTMAELGNLNGGLGTPITDEASCESYFSGLFQAFVVSSVQSSESKGRASYDGNAAGTCIDAVASMSCADFAANLAGSGTFPGCTNPITPKVADGGACSQDYECTSGYCMGATSSADGACAAEPTSGQTCDSTCADGFYCDYSSGTGACAAQKSDGASCFSNDECQHACNGADAGTGTAGTCGAAMTCNGM